MSKSLEGKVALITGGSRGLGAAAAVELAERGADVALTYRASKDAADAVVRQIQDKGRRAVALECDQADPAAAEAMIARMGQQFDALDILVNNAAITVQGMKTDDAALNVEDLQRQWNTNVMGVLAVTRAASRNIADGGRIVFVGSAIASRVAFSGVADYAATKAAIAGYAKGVARDLGPRNITVNVVEPGIMPTDMAADAAHNVPDTMMDFHAIRRIATLKEVAATICFLAGPDAAYISGSVLQIAGGFHI